MCTLAGSLQRFIRHMGAAFQTVYWIEGDVLVVVIMSRCGALSSFYNVLRAIDFLPSQRCSLIVKVIEIHVKGPHAARYFKNLKVVIFYNFKDICKKCKQFVNEHDHLVSGTSGSTILFEEEEKNLSHRDNDQRIDG